MKFLFFILFISLSFVVNAQSNIERALDNAEKELYRLEQVKTDIQAKMIEHGQTPQLKQQFQQAKNALKLQEKKTRALRREYKKIQKQRQKGESSPTNYPQNRPTKQPVNNQPTVIAPQSDAKALKQAKKERKNQIKALKKEIKTLEAERKSIVVEAHEAGQNPFGSEVVQDYDRRILAKQNDLVKLETEPLELPKPQQVQITAPPTPQLPVSSPEPTITQMPIETEPMMTEAIEIEVPEVGLSTILFPKTSTYIPEDYNLYLNYVAQQMQDNPLLILHIDAFTDNSEKNRVSAQVTKAMASEVAQAMVNRGIPAARLRLKAHGSKKAVGSNKTFFGQARNRRVELEFSAPN